MEKLDRIEARYLELERQLADPAIASDYQHVTKLAREQVELREVVETYHHYKRVSQELGEAQELLEMADDPDMQALATAKLRNWQRRRRHWPGNCTPSSCPKTPVIRKTSLSRSGRALAATKPACLLPTCIA